MLTEMTNAQTAAIDAPLQALLELTREIIRPHVLTAYGDDAHLDKEVANVLFQALLTAVDNPWSVLQPVASQIGYLLRGSAETEADCVENFEHVRQWIQNGIDAAQAEAKAKRVFDA